jgi:hypothetical protein
LPYAILAIVAMWYAARRVTGLRGVVIGFGSFPALLGSLAAVITGRETGFTVTSKASQRARSRRYLVVYVVLTAACVFALVWATQTHVEHQASLFISVLWISYSLLLLGSFLWLAGCDARLHRVERDAERERRSTGKHAYSSRLLGHPTGLKPVWCLGLAAALAAPVILNARVPSLRVFRSPDAPVFAMGAEDAGARYTGLSLPLQLLRTAPPHLEREVGVRFSIIGRTQDIGDNFDRGWADQLASHGARPWITLQFGEFGPGHKAPLDSNLPAIVNGVRDGDLRRWAREIRAFGRPVYLTVFLHADKNWSVSSGVAHGGIPADVAKAWTHVQSVFRGEGADNVAWVWAPADPVNDREFAPPPSTIDAVLQSFINYPGTQWGDPQSVLDGVAARYPDKPLFVEASAAGPAAQKAAWVTRLARAVDGSPDVYAVLYHEGGPNLTASSATTKEWSLASDSQSLASVRRLMSGLRSTGNDG